MNDEWADSRKQRAQSYGHITTDSPPQHKTQGNSWIKMATTPLKQLILSTLDLHCQRPEQRLCIWQKSQLLPATTVHTGVVSISNQALHNGPHDFWCSEKKQWRIKFLLASSKTYIPSTVSKKDLNIWTDTIHNQTSQHLLKVEHRLLNLNESKETLQLLGACQSSLAPLNSHPSLISTCAQIKPCETTVVITVSLSENTTDMQNRQMPF